MKFRIFDILCTVLGVIVFGIMVIGYIIGFIVDWRATLSNIILILCVCAMWATLILGCIYIDKMVIGATLKRYAMVHNSKTPKDYIYVFRRIWMVITAYIMFWFGAQILLPQYGQGALNDALYLTNRELIITLLTTIIYLWSVLKYRTGNWGLSIGYILCAVYFGYCVFNILHRPSNVNNWVEIISTSVLCCLSIYASIVCIKYSVIREREIGHCKNLIISKS